MNPYDPQGMPSMPGMPNMNAYQPQQPMPGQPPMPQQGGMDQNQMMLDYLLKMGELQPEQEAVTRQRSMVSRLREQGQQPGMRQAGRLVTAANPLEFLAAAGSNYMAGKREQEADTMQDEYKQKRLDALGDLRKRYGLGAQTTPPITAPQIPQEVFPQTY